MNILVIADYFLPHAGGSRVYYHNIYSAMVSKFPDRVTILTKKVPGWQSFDAQFSSPSLQFRRRFKPLPTLKLMQLPKIFFPLVEVMLRGIAGGADVIHAGDLYPQGLIAAFAKLILGIPYLVYCHGEEITMTDRFRYQPKVRNWIYWNADVIVAASEFARENLLRIGIPEEKIATVTPGVDFDRFRPRQVKKDLWQEFSRSSGQTLLTVARLFPRKGHETIIRAVAELVADFPNILYLIVGTGPEEKRLKNLTAALGLSSAVKFLGYVSDDQLPEFYNLADIFVMTNREEEDGDTEGFGMVFLEANATGKPVVAGRAGGTAGSVIEGVTGFRVDPADVREVASRIRTLLSDPALRERMGQAGMTRARTEFDWCNRASRIRELSLTMVERRLNFRKDRRPLRSSQPFLGK